MSLTTRFTCALSALALAALLTGCEDKPAASDAPASTSPPPPTAAPAPTAKPTATAAAEPEVKPSHPCPEGSEGGGTFKKPCDGKGTTRLMEVTWTGKTDEKKGPQFRVVNKTKLEILYGYLVVYFYDKAGKQLEVPATGDAKPRPAQTCGGNIFAGPMKAGEKATLWFSCVKNKHVPEGTAHIEAELRTVGFTGKDGKKADTYWRNKDLVPNERPKGGIK